MYENTVWTSAAFLKIENEIVSSVPGQLYYKLLQVAPHVKREPDLQFALL